MKQSDGTYLKITLIIKFCGISPLFTALVWTIKYNEHLPLYLAQVNIHSPTHGLHSLLHPQKSYNCLPYQHIFVTTKIKK